MYLNLGPFSCLPRHPRPLNQCCSCGPQLAPPHPQSMLLSWSRVASTRQHIVFLVVAGISGQHWFGGRGGWVITISNYFLSLWEPATWNLRSSFCASSRRLPNPEWALWALSATKNKVKTIILKLLFFALTTLMALIGIFAIYGKTPKPVAWNPRAPFAQLPVDCQILSERYERCQRQKIK